MALKIKCKSRKVNAPSYFVNKLVFSTNNCLYFDRMTKLLIVYNFKLIVLRVHNKGIWRLKCLIKSFDVDLKFKFIVENFKIGPMDLGSPRSIGPIMIFFCDR